MSIPVPSLQHSLLFDEKGRVKWDEKGLSLNARLAVSDAPQVVELYGIEGWMAFWHAAKNTGWMPTAPGAL